MTTTTVAERLGAPPRPVVTVRADADVGRMLAALLDTGARHLWVVEDDGRYVGHVDIHALAQIVLGQRLPVRSRRALVDRRGHASARDLADAHVRPAHLDEPLDLALEHMLAERIDALPVVDPAGRVVGELSLADALQRARDA